MRVAGWHVVRYTSSVMTEFVFSPPLLLWPDVNISTMGEAAAYLQNCTDVRQPRTHNSVLRMITSAATPEQEYLAAKAFWIWAEAEGLLLGDK
jgi:hypothetical protein